MEALKNGYKTFILPLLLLVALCFNLLELNWFAIGLYGFMVYRLLFRKPKTLISLHIVDVGILVLLLFEAVMLCFSANSFNSANAFVEFSFCCAAYFACKYTYTSLSIRRLFSYFFAGNMGICLLLTLFSFLFFEFEISYNGFQDILNFRFRYHPLGKASNDWVSYLLLFLPHIGLGIYYAHKKQHVVFYGAIVLFVLNLYCVLISFSRGAYIALWLGVLCVGVLFFLYVKKNSFYRYGVLGILMVLICGLGLCLGEAFGDTLMLFSNESHTRSFEGRTRTWWNVLELWQANPYRGIGSGNYALAYDSNIVMGENELMGRISNTYLQLLLEKGIIGFLLYASFFVTLMVKLGQQIKKNSVKTIIALAALISMFVRELSFSSLLGFHTEFLLLFILLNYFSFKAVVRIKSRVFTFMLAFCCLSAGTATWVLMDYEKQNQNLVEAYLRGEAPKETTGFDTFQSLTNQAILLSSGDFTTLDDATTSKLDSVENYLQKALTINPKDANTLHNLAQIAFLNQDTLKAVTMLNQALTLKPHNAFYNLAKFQFTGKENYVLKALLREPSIVHAPFWKSLTGTQQKKLLHQAIQYLTKKRKSLYAKARLASLYVSNCQYAKAQPYVDTVLHLMPNWSQVWLQNYFCTLARADTTNALKHLSKAKFLDPNSYRIDYEYARHYKAKGLGNDTKIAYINTLKNFARLNTPSARVAQNKYGLESLPNDLFPPSLLYYYKPAIPIDAILTELRELETKPSNLKLINQILRNPHPIHTSLKLEP